MYVPGRQSQTWDELKSDVIGSMMRTDTFHEEDFEGFEGFERYEGFEGFEECEEEEEFEEEILSYKLRHELLY